MKKGSWFISLMFTFIFIASAWSGQRHWVGNGTGNGRFWDKTANWSLTQGGPGGAGVPTASDDVFIDGGGSMQNNTNAVCLSFNQSISTGTKDFTNNSTLTVGSGGFVITGGTLSLFAANNTITVSGDITINGGTLDLSGTTPVVNAGGNWNLNSGSFTSSTGTVVFNGTNSQTITGSTTFGNLTINNSNGVTLNSSVTVNGTLTLTSGTVTTGSNSVILAATGTLLRTSGYVNGNLQKNVATGATSLTYEIGDATNYTPVNVTFGNVTAAGDLTVRTTSGEHPDIVNSRVDAGKDVNRYWTLTNGGVVFNNYSATFNFVPGDVDAGASTASFIVDRFTGSSWSATATGTRTSTSTQGTGLTAFGEFAAGDAKTITITASAGSNGTISPSGATVVAYGGSQTYAVSAAANYHISDVVVDGGSVGAVTSYPFTNVTTNHTITASFAINTHTLVVTALNGSVTKNPDQANYDHGSNVQLTATADTGYHFTGWSGDASGAVNPLTVTMDTNKNITANFAINIYTLGVTATNGTVGKNPDQANYDFGTSVVLTATPAVGYSFVSWSGDASGSSNPLKVTMDGDKNITANFAINTYTLDVTATNGTVGKNPDQANYDFGTSVVLTATPAVGYSFVSWSGDASGSSNPLKVSMDGNKNIAANFAINT